MVPIMSWVLNKAGFIRVAKQQDPTFSVWLCASFDESYRIFNELSAGFDELHDLIHGSGLCATVEKTHFSCD